jgi:hypothetical protein
MRTMHADHQLDAARPRRRRLPSAIWALALLLSISCLTAPSAGAVTEQEEINEYKDGVIEACCSGEVMEGGAIEHEEALISNVGTATWGVPGTPTIDLGTEGETDGTIAGTHFGEDEPDDFEMLGWPRKRRPVVGLTYEVPHGFNYKFAWPVKAPEVTEEKQYVVSFAALAERPASSHLSGWMDLDSGYGENVKLGFVVKPWAPPTAAISVQPQTVAPGESFTVTVNATAVASVNHVIFQYEGQTVEAVRPRNPSVAFGQQAEWTTSHTFTAIGSGAERVVGTAYDDSTRGSAGATAPLEVTHAFVKPPPPKHGVDPFGTIGPFEAVFFPGARSTSSSLALKTIVIRKLGKGERVELVCHHCLGATKLGPITAHAGSVTLPVHNLRVTQQSRLIVYVTKPGFKGRFGVYSFNPRRHSVKTPLAGCLTPGTKSRTHC